MNPLNKSTLPENFDGIFRFTNFTEEEFKAKWDNVEYNFPKLSQSPLIIPMCSPEQVQSIRKKFAKELAIREFYRTEKFKIMNSPTPGGVPPLYTDSDLAPFIQRCLEPLPVGKVITKPAPKILDENNLRKNAKGKPVSKVLDKDDSLLKEGTEDSLDI